MSLKKTLASTAVAIAASLVTASGALAATISLSQGCYVAQEIGKPVSIQVSGSGFTPGEQVFAQIPAPGGLLDFVETTVGPEGSISATLSEVIPPNIEPVAENEKMQIKGVLSGAILAEAPFQLTTLAVKLSPASAPPKKKVSYQFAGFKPGAIVYGHYLHRGRAVITKKLGKATGACGVLKTRARIFPGRSRYSHYAVQFDQSKKYRKGASPKIDTSVSLLRF